MFDALVALHNVLRWVVVAAAVIALVNAFAGWFGNRPWTARDRRLGAFFAISMDVQVALGLILWVRFVLTLPGGFEAAMGEGALRFFALEHLVGMIVALVLIHAGQILGRRAASDRGQFRLNALFFLVATLVILAAIPWPGLRYGRSLWPVL
ncbi:MAG: hypothetical protein RMM58_00160 [Chloroflexota bacterium]|nr:hypothetical protein [Dehalococcoidia bacterium]MDW8252271.1 hypothetical protein [Chloroflexota bacterium]